MDPGGDDQQFWLSGTLRVFAMEQVEFLQRLYHNALSFSLVGQRLVKDLMVNEAGQKWILRARSGWVAVPEQPAIGWWDGWAERAKGLVFLPLIFPRPRAWPMRRSDKPSQQKCCSLSVRCLKTFEGLLGYFFILAE